MGFTTRFAATLHPSKILLGSCSSPFKTILFSLFRVYASKTPLSRFLRLLSAHRTPVVINRPFPPCSFSTAQQYRMIRVGGISFCGIKSHMLVRLPL